jgi:hypothetical protein
MIRYFLNGTECNPANKDSVNYVFNFEDRRISQLELSVDTLEFVNEDRIAIKSWIETYGYFVGMPLDIKYSNGTIVKYILDFQDPAFREKERSYKVKLKKYKGVDNFFDNADGMAFSLVNWSPSDFTQVDYVIIPEGQANYFISLMLATFALSQEIAKAVDEIQQSIGDLFAAATPIPGLSPTGPTVSYNVPAIVVAGIKLAARVAYAIFIVIALVKLLTEIINVIFPVIRQFKAIKVKTLFEKSCAFLGYSVSSTLLNSLTPLTILPVPLKSKKNSWFLELIAPNTLAYTNGYPSSRDSVKTLGQLISALEDTFNAKIKVSNGIVTFEQENFFLQTPNTGLLSAFNLQSELQSEHSQNSDEISKRRVVQFQTDPTDFNTFDDTFQSLFEISSEVENSPDRALELIRGYDLINIPFARGTNKGSLNFLERSAKVLARAVDLFCGSNLTSKVNARKNVMQVSSQYFSVTKLLWMNGTRLHQEQTNFIGAQAIMLNYWYSRFIENNQKNIYDSMPVAMTENELFALFQNNFITMDNGQVAEIVSVQWSELQAKAMVTYNVLRPRINEKSVQING